MGAGKVVKGGIDLVETFLKELNKPAKAAVKAAPQDEALRLAQLRAALPPAQGGLGLPANNTPMQRAEAGKFVIPAYHGGDPNIKKFMPKGGKDNSEKTLEWYRQRVKNNEPVGYMDFRSGSFFSPATNIASDYAKEGAVYPVLIRSEMPLDLEIGTTKPKRIGEKPTSTIDALKLYRDGNLDEISIMDPDQVRSRFAAFDPWRKDAATAAAFGVAAPDLLAKEQEKAMGGDVHMMGGGRPPKKTTLEEDLKSFKDPAMALADLLAGAARGTTAAATGIYGDMEELLRQYGKGVPGNVVRLLMKPREGSKTTFPTIEEMNAMLPPVVPAGAGRSTQVADIGQFFGENNPAAPTAIAAVKPIARAVKAAAPIIKAGALDLAKSEPARRAVNQVMRATGTSPMELMAYQGSPHLYAPTAKNPLGELDPSKIGSGEGAQAYGMGHYLAENRNVGEGYRNSISSQHGQDVTVGGVPVDEYYMNVYGNADQLPLEEARQQYDKAALIEMLSFNRSPNDILSYAEDMGYAPSVIDWFKTDVIPKTKMPGYLYTHDLSDEAIARMLDYDLPLKDQPHIIEAIDKHYDPEVFLQQLELSPESTGGDFQAALQGPRTSERMKQASETLRSKFGIPGVKYLDQESKARQAMDPEFTGGTRNFVLFPGEEDASKIIRREKTGGAVMMGAGGTVKKGIELVDTFLNALKEGEKPARAAKAIRPSKEVAQAAAKAVKDAEQLASAPVVQTVANPERMQFPGIYKRPDVIAAEAAARVAPESPNLQRLFGVTREDLYQMGKGRKGNLPGTLPGLAANPKGSKVGAQITTPQNTQRLIDVMTEAEKHPALVRGMDPWYVMDPLFQRMSRELGPERAATEYNLMNNLFGMSSPGSEVMTEIPRGSAAYYLHKQGRFPEFEQYAGMPAHLRGEDFPQDIRTVPGHAYHSTAQAGPMRKFLEKGELDMSSPKVPMYIQASGVPETGFQTATPVGDAHWSRAVGLADVRGGSPANWKKSVSNTEMYDLGPWWREQVAAPLGLESVPAQARAWGAFSPQTGVTTPIGAPKLELIADQTAMAADRLGISPEDALIMFINAKARLGKKEGGAVESDVDGFLDYMNKAQY